MKYFIALAANKYNLRKGIKPINLAWEKNKIKNWIAKVRYTKNDILIGHSLGAAVILIAVSKKKIKPREIHLYSPSPIFSETIKLLDKKNLKIFGKERQKEIEPIPKNLCPVNIYIGENETSTMKKTAKKIHLALPNSKLFVISGKDHKTIIEETKFCY